MPATASQALMILVAGPYRSGTGDDPALIHRNVQAMTAAALALFRAGHLPVLGEWFALPLIQQAGSQAIGDPAFDEIFHPVSRRLVARCDACLRIGGASVGADEMVALSRSHGLPVYFALDEVPAAGTATGSADDAAASAEAAARTHATQRLLDARPERVYQAFSQPGQLARWWGPAGFSNEFQAFDFRPGGDWRFVMRSRDGLAFANHNVFDELQADRRVVIRHASSPHFVLIVTLQAQGAQTLLRWQQAFASADEAQRLAAVVQPANEQNLDRLQRLLAGLAPDAG